MSIKHIIKLRRGTEEEWAVSSPQPDGEVLKLGEPGFEKDTGKLKIGDGVNGWNNLAYLQAENSENSEDVILTEEDVDDAVGNLLVGGSGINIYYNDSLDTLTIGVSGLDSSFISNFNESVQDNLNTFLVAGSGISFNYDSGNDNLTISNSGTVTNYTDNRILTSDGTSSGINAESLITASGAVIEVGTTGLSLAGTALPRIQLYSAVDESAKISFKDSTGADKFNIIRDDEDDENRIVSDSVLRIIATGQSINISSSGLLYNSTQVSVSGHTHTSSNITDFTESVQDVVGASGFLVGQSGIDILYNDGSNTLTITNTNAGTTITNAADNRILTSDGTSTGINGESNLTFDGSILAVSGTIRLGDTAGNRVQFFKGGGSVYDYSIAKEGNHLAVSTSNDGATFRYTQFGYHSGSTWTPKTVINNYNGYVGIGTTTPTAHLQVVGTGLFTNIDINNSAIAGSSALTVNGSISTQSQGVIAGQFSAYGDQNTRLYKPDSTTFAMSSANSGIKQSFGYLVSNTHTPWMTITNSGVGIGTTSPTYTLHVVGSGYFNGSLDVDNLRLDSNTLSSTNSNSNIVLAPNGTGDVQVDADTLRVGDSNAAATVTTNGTGNLTLSTNGGTNSGTIVINQGSSGNISITPNGTGEVDLSKVDIDGGSIDNTAIGVTSAASGKFTQLYPTVVDNGTVSGNVATNVANSQIFDMIVTGTTTLSNPTNSVNGVTVRWRITQDGTGNHSISLDNKFQIPSSASSPLPFSIGANSMDVLAATYHAGRDKWDVVAFVPGY